MVRRRNSPALPADLGVHPLPLSFPVRRGGLRLVREHVSHAPSGLPLPSLDQRLVHAVLRGQLRHRQLDLHRLQRNRPLWAA